MSFRSLYKITIPTAVLQRDTEVLDSALEQTMIASGGLSMVEGVGSWFSSPSQELAEEVTIVSFVAQSHNLSLVDQGVTAIVNALHSLGEAEVMVEMNHQRGNHVAFYKAGERV